MFFLKIILERQLCIHYNTEVFHSKNVYLRKNCHFVSPVR
jgi:hypothetical protein